MFLAKLRILTGIVCPAFLLRLLAASLAVNKHTHTRDRMTSVAQIERWMQMGEAAVMNVFTYHLVTYVFRSTSNHKSDNICPNISCSGQNLNNNNNNI